MRSTADNALTFVPDPVDGRLPVELIPYEDPGLAAAVDECRPLLPPP